MSRSQNFWWLPDRLPNSACHAFLWLSVGLALAGGLSSAGALVMGIVFSLLTRNPYVAITRKWSSWTLAIAVVGLGAGSDFSIVARQGMSSIVTTLGFIGACFVFSFLIRKLLNTEEEVTTLISSGTAICGGSAIAAVSSAIQASPENISVAMGCVFLLNSVGLIVFPPLGHWFGLTEREFGLWSAFAIHDTSSVVGASLQYGAIALSIATTTKLVRALWIAPLAIVIGLSKSQGSILQILKKQWFIGGFLLFSISFTWIPQLQKQSAWMVLTAKRLMVVTLFLIGASFTVESLRKTGLQPLVHAILLWVSIGVLALGLIKMQWV